VITKLLEGDIFFSSMTFMMQKEVAKRMCAENGKRECGAITALIRYHSEPKLQFNVSREVFIPRPNVDSAVIRFDILDKKTVSPINERFFFKVIRAGFNHRRKTLLNALTGFNGLDKHNVQRAFSIADVQPGRRSESLTLEEFRRLSDALMEISDDQ
jgi:16S rRNA (adenine1518-N6/adenine1519-N6)-dimethyltransferase